MLFLEVIITAWWTHQGDMDMTARYDTSPSLDLLVTNRSTVHDKTS